MEVVRRHIWVGNKVKLNKINFWIVLFILTFFWLNWSLRVLQLSDYVNLTRVVGARWKINHCLRQLSQRKSHTTKTFILSKPMSLNLFSTKLFFYGIKPNNITVVQCDRQNLKYHCTSVWNVAQRNEGADKWILSPQLVCFLGPKAI